MLLIRGEFSYSKAKTRRIAPNTGNVVEKVKSKKNPLWNPKLKKA